MRPAAGAFRLTDPRGRGWARGLAWRVTTSAGEPHDVSSLQEAIRRAITWQIGHGRHRLTLADLADLTGAAHRGSVWHALVRLRSLNLVAYRAPARGRNGTFAFWLPRPGAARLAARMRSQQWPSRAGARPDRGDPSANVVTPTAFGGNLTREGIRRAWRARRQSGDPPVPLAPRRGAAGASTIRARRRPWPPRYVDERCPGGGHRARLALGRSETGAAGDVAATWSGRCHRDRQAIAVGLLLVVEPPPVGLETAGDVAATLGARSRPVTGATRKADSTGADRTPLPHRRALAVAILADGVPPDVADRLRVDHLGYRRRPLAHPADRPAVTSPAGGMDPVDLAAIAWSQIAADLAMVDDSRRLDLPDRTATPTGHNQPPRDSHRNEWPPTPAVSVRDSQMHESE